VRRELCPLISTPLFNANGDRGRERAVVTDEFSARREGAEGKDGQVTAISHAHAFNTAAAQYAASHPSYPPALLDAVEELTGRPSREPMSPTLARAPESPPPCCTSAALT
jgi:hypothetical protein